jgi:hypothetical protein
MGVMKAVTFAFLAASVSFAMPLAAAPLKDPGQSRAESSDKPGQSYDQKVGAPVKPHEQQAEMGSGQDHNRYCAGLKQRSKELWAKPTAQRITGISPTPATSSTRSTRN